MTRDEAVARIKLGLDFRTGTVDDANLVARLVESQRLLEKGKDLPRFLRQEDQTLIVEAEDGTVTLPTGFLREVDGEGPAWTNEYGQRVGLEKMRMEEAQLRFDTVSAGRPRAYVIRKTSLFFFPIADAEYELSWSYYKSATALSTGSTENEWLANAPEILIGHAGMRYAKDLGNVEAAERFLELFNEAWNAQFAEDYERELDNDLLLMGGRL